MRLGYKGFGPVHVMGLAAARRYEFGEDLLLLFQFHDHFLR